MFFFNELTANANFRFIAVANYSVTPSFLEPYIPAGVSLDYFDGEAILSAVGMTVTDMRVCNFPVPLHQCFEYFYLRFAVKRASPEGFRRGFCSIGPICPSFAVSLGLGIALGLGVRTYRMDHAIEADGTNFRPGSRASYRFRSRHRWNELEVRPEGQPNELVSGSLAQFLVERPYFYSMLGSNVSSEVKLSHDSWRYWNVASYAFLGDFTRIYGESFSSVLTKMPSSAFLFEGSEVSISMSNRLRVARVSNLTHGVRTGAGI